MDSTVNENPIKVTITCAGNYVLLASNFNRFHSFFIPVIPALCLFLTKGGEYNFVDERSSHFCKHILFTLEKYIYNDSMTRGLNTLCFDRCLLHRPYFFYFSIAATSNHTSDLALKVIFLPRKIPSDMQNGF